MIIQEQVDNLKAQMIEACDKHLAEGGIIASGAFVSTILDDNDCKCPLGCLAEGRNYFAKANKILEVSPDSQCLWDFVEAFDGQYCEYPSMLRQLGQELRAKYIISKRGT